MRESQYIEEYLETASKRLLTPSTFLMYRLRGNARNKWFYSYYTSLMRAIEKRVKNGTVWPITSKGYGVAYVPVGMHKDRVFDTKFLKQ